MIREIGCAFVIYRITVVSMKKKMGLDWNAEMRKPNFMNGMMRLRMQEKT